MLIETLNVLRCPYCGGRLSLVDSLFESDARLVLEAIRGLRFARRARLRAHRKGVRIDREALKAAGFPL